MTRSLAAVFSFLLLSLAAASAFACKCEKNIDPIKGSKMVFWGKAVQITPRGAQDKVKFQISQLYKGDERPTVAVYTNRFEHDCGFQFEVDKSYMVYGTDFYPRGVATGICWGSYEATEPVAEDAWRKLKVEVADETKRAAELRKLATKIVPTCGHKHRVTDSGFFLILSPEGDPIRPTPPKRIRPRVEEFQRCVTEAFLSAKKLPKTEKSTRLIGWYRKQVRRLPVLIDEVDCGENCPDWANRVKLSLLSVGAPEAVDKNAVQVKAEMEQCIEGGIEAVGGESFGAESFKTLRNRMLADCASRRGEFEQAVPYYDSVMNLGILAALQWAVKQAKTEGPVFPIGSAGEHKFTRAWMGKKSDAGRFRILRSYFSADRLFAESPVYLEAFAESILADKAAPPKMRKFAALAYHRAGILRPEAAEAYGKLADKASKSKAATELREQLTASYAAANAPPVEEEPVEVVEEEVVEETMEEPAQGQDSMLLVVAGVLIVVAVAGIGTILKRRK